MPQRIILFLLLGIINWFLFIQLSFGFCGELKPLILQKTLLNSDTASHQKSYMNEMMIFYIKGYQRMISPVDGDRCKMYPTCSAYSYKVYQQYGLLLGSLLTFDRLTHEMDEYKFTRIIDDQHDPDWLKKKYRNLIIFDPPENNVFWWKNNQPQ
jgi:Putative membrane protein insertion efficiency factor